MNRIIEEFDFPASWFTGEKITLGEQVLLEVDVRHFAPVGWSTYKFMDPDKAAEFASQWAANGGAVVAGQDSVDNELVGSRSFYYIFAGPLQSFYGMGEDEIPSKSAKNEACACMGLTKKPTPKYKDKMKKDDQRLASQGTFADFYEATSKDKTLKFTGKEAFVLRAVLFDAFHSKALKALSSKFQNEIDGWMDEAETLKLTASEHKELCKVLQSYLDDQGFMNSFFRVKGMKGSFVSAARKCGAQANLKEAAKPDGMSKEEWEAEVTSLMKQTYGLDPNDFDMTYSSDMTPAEYVEWYGEKYDLDELDPDGKKAWGL